MGRSGGLLGQATLLTLALIAIAFVLHATVLVSLASVGTWLLVATAFYHLLFWINRKRSTQTEIRAVEYLFIALGIFGTLSVMEPQSDLLLGRQQKILSRYGSNEGIGSKFCDAYREVRSKENRQNCFFETAYKQMFERYDHTSLGLILGVSKPTVCRMRRASSSMI
jgi:hypothetical protein